MQARREGAKEATTRAAQSRMYYSDLFLFLVVYFFTATSFFMPLVCFLTVIDNSPFLPDNVQLSFVILQRGCKRNETTVAFKTVTQQLLLLQQ